MPDFSCSDGDSEMIIDCDIFLMAKFSSIYYLSNRDSESCENGLDIEDKLVCNEINEIPSLEPFLGETGIEVWPSDPTNIVDVAELL